MGGGLFCMMDYSAGNGLFNGVSLVVSVAHYCLCLLYTLRVVVVIRSRRGEWSVRTAAEKAAVLRESRPVLVGCWLQLLLPALLTLPLRLYNILIGPPFCAPPSPILVAPFLSLSRVSREGGLWLEWVVLVEAKRSLPLWSALVMLAVLQPYRQALKALRARPPALTAHVNVTPVHPIALH